MNRTVKKQFWLTREEDELLKLKAQQCCLPEASLLRMLIQDLVPKEKPPKEFYEVMREVYRFGSNLSQLADVLEYAKNEEKQRSSSMSKGQL